MSASLLRKGLELLGAPAAPGPGRGARKRTPRKRTPRKDQATVKGKVTKSALEEFQKRQSRDRLRENLRLLGQSRVTADRKVTAKVLLHNQGRQARDRPAPPPEQKPQGTVFTEEDFRRFQEEYFGGPGPK